MSFSSSSGSYHWPALVTAAAAGATAGFGAHWYLASRLHQEQPHAESQGSSRPLLSTPMAAAPPPATPTTVPTPKHTATDGSAMRAYALRLTPGQELKSSLLAYVEEHNLGAATVVTCVGSLQKATLRLANADRDSGEQETETREEKFEILSLVGTLSTSHGCHLHCSLGDAEGAVWGGHCVGDMVVNTTAEIVLAECEGLSFERHYDERTGFKELCVLCGPAYS